MGGEIITDTVPRIKAAGASPWKGVLVINDTVFTTLTGSLRGSFGSTSVKAGTVVPGTFSTITLASGVVIALDDAT